MTLSPNFFIVGTPKSGTTSLFHYLQEHPEVFIPSLKEPHFFSSPEVKNTYYKTKIVDNKEEYLKLYQSDKEYKVVGDLSSSYLFNKHTASRISDFNPKSKIIIVLRNPVERAVSHYLMDVSLGYINVSLKEVLTNKETYKKFYQEYVEIGFYDKQIEEYKSNFPDSQLLIILSESLQKDTDNTLKNIFKYLNISTEFSLSSKVEHNKYREARFPFLKKILNSDIIKSLFPNSIKEKLKPIIYNQKAEKPKLEAEKEMLKKIYKNSIINTENMISKDLSSWK
jgi:hypothetical protein